MKPSLFLLRSVVWVATLVGALIAGGVPADARNEPGLHVSLGTPASHAYPALPAPPLNPAVAGPVYPTPNSCGRSGEAPYPPVAPEFGPCDRIPLVVDLPSPKPGDEPLLTVTVHWGPGATGNEMADGLWDCRHTCSFASELGPTPPEPVRVGGAKSPGQLVLNYADPPTPNFDLVVENTKGVNTGYEVRASVTFVHDGAGRSATAVSPGDTSAGSDSGAPATGRGGAGAVAARSTTPTLGVAITGDPRFLRLRALADNRHRARLPGPVSRWAAFVAAACALGAAGVWWRALTMRAERRARFGRRFRNVRLFWKLLAPFVTILLVVGVSGAFLTVRYLSSRAQTTLDENLLQRSAGADAFLRDQELSVLDGVRFAANVEGLPEALAAHDQAGVAKPLGSAVATHRDLDVFAVTDEKGAGLVDYVKVGANFTTAAGGDWMAVPAVNLVLKSVADAAGDKHTNLVRLADGRTLFVVAGPVHTNTTVGAVIAGIDADKLAAGAAGRAGAGIAVYDEAGTAIGRSKGAPRTTRLPGRMLDATGSIRRRERVGSRDIATVYQPLILRGVRVGTLAVSTPVGPAFAAVRGAALRLALIVALAMIATVGIGVALSRYILRSLNPLVATNRALAAGDLSARTPVLSDDELGEVAEGVNQMAAALEESYATLEAKVEERTAEVQRLLDERTEFFTAVSHEFRTPLAVILGQAKMLGDAAFDKKAAWHAQASAVLTDAGNQLLGFVNDILEIAKLESGRTELNLLDVHVDRVLRDLEASVETLGTDNGVKVTVRCPRRLPPVKADPTRLREVVLNLVDNAVKYTPPGGTVTVSTAVDGGRVVVAVTDTGVGIPADAISRLFEPFYRVKGTETQGGQPSSGLGLAVVKGLVDAMGGDIGVVSTVGKGTTFTVTFPAADVRGPSGSAGMGNPAGPWASTSARCMH